MTTRASRRAGQIKLSVVRTGAMVAWRSLAQGKTAGSFPADGTNEKSGEAVNALMQSGVQGSDIRDHFNGVTAVAAGVA